jgi:hypothetical protein
MLREPSIASVTAAPFTAAPAAAAPPARRTLAVSFCDLAPARSAPARSSWGSSRRPACRARRSSSCRAGTASRRSLSAPTSPASCAHAPRRGTRSASTATCIPSRRRGPSSAASTAARRSGSSPRGRRSSPPSASRSPASPRPEAPPRPAPARRSRASVSPMPPRRKGSSASPAARFSRSRRSAPARVPAGAGSPRRLALRARFAARREAPHLGLAVHPQDLFHPALRATLFGLVREALASRVPVTLGELAAASRPVEPPPRPRRCNPDRRWIARWTALVRRLEVSSLPARDVEARLEGKLKRSRGKPCKS